MSVNFRDLQKASCLKGMRDRSNHLGRRDCLQICPRQCCTAQTAEGTGCCRATTSSRYFRGLRAIDRPLHANQRCFASDPPGSCSHLWLTCPRNPWISWCKLLRPKDVQTDGFFPKHRFSMLTSEPRPRFQEAVNIRRQQLQVLKETEGAGADMLTTSATLRRHKKDQTKIWLEADSESIYDMPFFPAAHSTHRPLLTHQDLHGFAGDGVALITPLKSLSIKGREGHLNRGQW